MQNYFFARFAMRLMHLGFDVYVLGETITPSIGEGDLVIVKGQRDLEDGQAVTLP